MDGPWYERYEITNKKVENILFNEQWDKLFNNIYWNENMKKIIIHRVLLDILNKDQSHSWGSYRGYYSFYHYKLISLCLEYAIIYRKKKASEIISHFMYTLYQKNINQREYSN